MVPSSGGGELSYILNLYLSSLYIVLQEKMLLILSGSVNVMPQKGSLLKKIRSVGICLLLALWVGLAGFLWFGKKLDYTYSERRPLAQMPVISPDAIWNGKFTADFEDFTLDQFPLRDQIRKIKSLFHYYVLNQSDNNGIYLVADTVAKLEYPMNKISVNYALGKTVFFVHLKLPRDF